MQMSMEEPAFTQTLSDILLLVERMRSQILQRRLGLHLHSSLERKVAFPLMSEEGMALDKLVSKVKELEEEHSDMMNYYGMLKVSLLPFLDLFFLLILFFLL